MNQILFFEENGIGKSMNKNVKFFAISLMAFGMILIGEGGYAFAKDRNEKVNQIATIQEAEDLKPTITYEQNNSKLLVTVEGKKEIATITCKWNNDQEQELLQVSGQTNVEREIDIPSGTNDLTIKVIYKDAPDFPYEQTATFTKTSTKIDWSVVTGTSKLQINIEDTTGLDNVSYKWNDDEEKIETPSAEDNTKLEIITDIPLGLNTVKVVATNMFGETTEESMEILGTTRPVINANVSENGMMTIEVTSNDNIENVNFSVNGEEYLLNISEFIKDGFTIEQLNQSPGLHLEENDYGKTTKLTYEFQLQQPTNEVSITAKTEYAEESVSGTLIIPTN